jgi:hypothetical protein
MAEVRFTGDGIHTPSGERIANAKWPGTYASPRRPSTAALVGKAIAALVHNGLFFWAAVETTGLVHAFLIGQLVFAAVVFIAYGTVAIAKADSR